MATVVTLGLLALLQLEHVSCATITSFKQKKKKRKKKNITSVISTPSSETQGQLDGAGKKFGRRKVKNEEKSPWGQSFNGPVPKRRGSSGF